jgi:FkbM family methyltransferase
VQLPQFVRDLTDPIIGRIPVPILGGANRGMLWSLASAGGGYVSGRRGLEQMAVMRALLHEGDVFWDVGAHHGSMTLCASRCVGKSGQVHAFEPAQLNLTYLGRHVRWNGLANVKIHALAMGSADGDATFGGSGSSTGYALNQGAEKVSVRTMATVVSSGAAPIPTFAKIDVQDFEGDVITGATRTLRSDTRLIIAIHSRRSHDTCTSLLNAAGYTIVESTPDTAAGTQHGDPDLACFGPDYSGTKQDCAMLKEMHF